MRWVELNWLHDAQVLRRVGRGPLASILEMFGAFLAEQHLRLPDPSLPDGRYFAELSALFRSQPIKGLFYLPPFFAATAVPGGTYPTKPPALPAKQALAAQALPPAPPRSVEPPDVCRYSLRREPGGWVVALNGETYFNRVHRSIQRLCEHLKTPLAGEEAPRPVAAVFAEYIEKHILVPSRRYTRARAGARVRIARGELAGRLVFECPPGHCWSVRF